MRGLDLERASKDRHSDVLNGKSQPRLDQAGCDIVGQGIGSRWPRGLDVELLQHLDRDRAVVLVEQANGAIALGGFRGVAADGIQEDVGVEKMQDGQA